MGRCPPLSPTHPRPAFDLRAAPRGRACRLPPSPGAVGCAPLLDSWIYRVSRSPYPLLAQDDLDTATPAQVAAWHALLEDPLPGLDATLGQWGQSEAPLDVAMARFAKSPEAFALAHDRPHDWPQIVEGLPGEGAQRLGRVLLAHRAWQVGQMLGYALSGAAQDDLDRWDVDADLREECANDREAFLRAQARANDGAPATWSAGAHPLALPADQHCFIAPPRPESGEVTARLGIVALGISVVQYDWATHAHRLSESVRAVAAMTREQMWGGEPNPYHGFRVLPFCCHAGLFCAQMDAPAPDMGWQSWLGADAAPDDILVLARAPFWSLFAHPQTTPGVLEHLQGLNPHILGCDTLPLYEHLAVEIAAGPSPRTRPQWVLSQARALIQALLPRDLTAPVPPDVDRGVDWILTTLARLPHHHLKAFPVARRDILPASERQSLEALAAALESLALAIGTGPWASHAGALRTAASHARALAK